MDLADLEMKISVDSQEAEARIERLDKQLNKLAKSISKVSVNGKRVEPLTGTKTTEVSAVGRAIGNTAILQNKTLKDTANNMKAYAKSMGSLSTYMQANLTNTKSNITSYATLGERAQGLRDKIQHLNSTYRAYSLSMQALDKTSGSTRAGLIKLTTIHEKDSDKVKAVKQAVVDLNDSYKKSKENLEAVGTANRMYVLQLQDELYKTKELQKAQKVLTTEKKQQQKLALEDFRTHYKKAKQEADVYHKAQIANEKDMYKQFKLAKSSAIIDAKSSTMEGKYTGNISPDSRWQGTIKDSKVAMQDWDKTFKEMDLAEKARAEEAMRTFRKTWTTAKEENTAYHKQVLQNEKDAFTRFKMAGRSVVQEAKSSITEGTFAGKITPDAEWKANIKDSKSAMQKWDADFNLHLQQLTQNEKDAYLKFKSASESVVQEAKAVIVSDTVSGKITTDADWKANIKDSKLALTKWDAEYNQHLAQLVKSEKDAYNQFKIASKEVVTTAKSEVTNAKYSGDISPDARWQDSIKDSKIAMRDWDAAFKEMDVADKIRAQEARKEFKATWGLAKKENKAYIQQRIQNEKDAHKQFRATWGNAKAIQREYYAEVKRKEQEQAKYIQLTNQAMAWRLNAMRDLSILFRQVGMAFTRYFTAPFVAFSVMAVKFTAEMEMQQKAFDILLGSASEGARVYGEVVRYAAETPYQLPELTQVTKELLAFGSASTEVMDELRRLGDIAQNDAEKLESVVQAFGKVQARGVAHMRELNRFIMAGVPIIGELGRVMNMGMDDLFRAVQRGNISFEAVKQAVQNLTNEGGKFYKMSKEMSELVAGRWSTLKDEFQLMARAFVEDYMPTILTVIEYTIDFTRAVQAMTEGQRSQIRTIALWVAAIGPVLLLGSKLLAFGMVIQRMIRGISMAWQAAKILKGMGDLAKGATLLGTTLKVALGGIPGIIAGVIVALTGIAAFAGFKKLQNSVKDTVGDFRDLRGELENIDKVNSNDAILKVLKKVYPKTGEYDIVNMELIEQFKAQGEGWDTALISELDKRKRADSYVSGLVKEYNTSAINTFKSLRDDMDKGIKSVEGDKAFLSLYNILEASGVLDFKDPARLPGIEAAKAAMAKGTAYFNQTLERDTRGRLAHTQAQIADLTTKARSSWNEAFNALYPSIGDVLSMLTTGDANKAMMLLLEKLMPDVDTLLEQIAMNRAVFEEKVDATIGDNIFVTLSKKLLADSDTSKIFAAEDTNEKKIGALLFAYVGNTMTAIDDAGLRLNKYMADMPSFQKYYEAIFKKMSPEEILALGDSFTVDIKAEFDKLLPDLTEAEKRVYNLFAPFFGDEKTIRLFFTQYAAMLKTEATSFVDNLNLGYAIDNIKSQFSLVPATSETRKSEAEFMLKGIEEQVKSFVQSKGPQTLADVTAAVEEFFNTNKDVKLTYESWLKKFNTELLAVDYDKEFNKLSEGIVTYGLIGEAASAAVYKLKGYSDAQIATLSTANQLKVGLEALQGMLDSPSVDTKAMIDIMSMKQTPDILLPDTMSDENKNTFKKYFADVYALDEQERLALRSTDIYNKMAKDLVDAGGTIIPDSLPSDVRSAVTKYFEAFYGMDVQEQAIEMASDNFKTLMKQLTGTYAEELNAMKTSGLRDYLTSLDNDLAGQVENIGKTANEIAIARLTLLKDSVEATDEIDILIDKVIESFKKLDKPVVKFEDELATIGTSLLNTSFNSLISELEEVGKAFVTADFAGRNFGDTIANIGMAIIDALPQLFLQAGLNVIASGNLPVGLGLIAMAGATSMFKGYMHGIEENGPASAPLPASSLTFSAKGNAFDKGRMLNVPTLFTSSRGFNMGGELGTEAILPLSRTSNGRLGVASSGAGNVSVSVPVSIEVINQTGANITAETQTTTGPNGEQNVKMIIKKVVAEQLAKGEYDGVMRNRYGASNRGVV